MIRKIWMSYCCLVGLLLAGCGGPGNTENRDVSFAAMNCETRYGTSKKDCVKDTTRGGDGCCYSETFSGNKCINLNTDYGWFRNKDGLCKQHTSES